MTLMRNRHLEDSSQTELVELRSTRHFNRVPDSARPFRDTSAFAIYQESIYSRKQGGELLTENYKALSSSI